MLTSKQKRILKAEAHRLKPVLRIGKGGITDALAQEIDIMLDSLELIKVKLNSNTAEDEASAVSALQRSVPDIEHVWTIGHTLLFFRSSRTHPTRYSI
jgi:RNA-binding protein